MPPVRCWRPPVLAAGVRTATEGNPFFVREMLDALSDDPTAGAPLTPRVRDIVRWRLGRLPEPTADVLAVAAVIGAEFDADVLAGAVGIELLSVLDALEAAERARLVRPAGNLDRFTFAHALVRETIADELPAGRRLRLHARIAHALERAAATRAVAAGDLATHFDYADHLEEDAEMVALLRRALALLAYGDSAIRARLEGFLAQEAFSTMPDAERRTMVRHALAMARRVGDPAALASVLNSHCWIVAGPERLSERLAIADELVAVGRKADLPYAECDGQQWRFFAPLGVGGVEGAGAPPAAAPPPAPTTK